MVYKTHNVLIMTYSIISAIIFLLQLQQVHSFIHSGDFRLIHIAPLQETTTQRRSQSSHGQKRKEGNSKGRSFHADGPTTEKALRCIIAKRARGTKNRTQHPTCGQNRHWAAEVAEVRGGAAKDTTGDHCSDTILYSLKYRQPMEYITHVGSDGRKLGQPPNKTDS